MAKETKTEYRGMGFLEVLTLILITLKLTGNLTWSWWWVLSPVIFETGIVILLIIIGVLLAIVT